jgi:hypothetical protein
LGVVRSAERGQNRTSQAVWMPKARLKAMPEAV